MNAKQIVFTAPNKAELIEHPIPALAPHQVMVKTAVSTISCGTEKANITGDPNVSIMAGADVSFPRSSGYSSAGVVVAVGDAVTEVKVGDRVAMFWSKHQNYNIVDEEHVVKIEDDRIGFDTAAMCFIASFSMSAIRKTRLEMGESAIVMGLGILGMIAVKLLRAAGAVPVIAVDPNPLRREVALKSGADYAFDPFEGDFVEKVKAVSGGGVNVAIEVTGVGAGFNQALDCLKKFGRVSLLGCTRNSDFKVDYYRKIHAPGITVIGANTAARPEHESYPGYFTHKDDIAAIMRLVAGGRLDLASLVEETHSPVECQEVYRRLVEDKAFPIAVQFDWSGLEA